MKTKICSKCGVEKTLDQFYKHGLNSKGEQTYRSDCKACQQKYDKKRLDTRVKFANNQKQSCAKCGDTRTYILQFHHKDPSTKDFTIGDMRNYSLDKIQKEIDKCIVLCANCHIEFHFLEKEQGITIEQFLAPQRNGSATDFDSVCVGPIPTGAV